MSRRVLPYALGGAVLGIVGGVALALGAWWLVWAGFALYFAVAEGFALANSRAGDTLSEHVWWLFATQRRDAARPVTGWVRLRRFVLLAFVAWLAAHFLTGGLF